MPWAEVSTMSWTDPQKLDMNGYVDVRPVLYVTGLRPPSFSLIRSWL